MKKKDGSWISAGGMSRLRWKIRQNCSKMAKKSTQIVLEFLKKELNPRARQTREREGVHARHARPHDNPDERLLGV